MIFQFECIWNGWLHKISISPQRRELEILSDWQIKNPGNSGGEKGKLVIGDVHNTLGIFWRGGGNICVKKMKLSGGRGLM